MTTNIFSILNIAKSSLFAQQSAIEVTGHNISNVQTKGYTRQEVNLETFPPRQSGLGLLGTGVKIRNITRDFDQFLFNQILGEGSTTGNFEARQKIFEKLDIIFNETTGRSLNSEFSEFFKGFDDLATNPTGLPERSTIIGNAQSLVSVFNLMGKSLFQERLDLNVLVEDRVTEINGLLDEIQELNVAIHANEPGDDVANDLRDQRDIRVRELSEKIDINIIEENSNQIKLTTTDGTPLILGIEAFRLSTATNGNNRGLKDVFVSDGGFGTVNITNRIQGGEIRGILDLRDREITSAIDQLDRLAAGVIQEVNRVHQQGVGLDGSTGNNFFAPLDPVVHADVNNTGSANVTMINASPTSVSVDKFELHFTSATSFDLVNTTTGVTSGPNPFVAGSTFNLVNGLAVTINGTAAAGDVFRFSVSEDAALKIQLNDAVVTDTRKMAAGLNGSEDGGNARALSDLQNRFVFDGSSYRSGSGSVTFNAFYNALVSSIGVASKTAQTVVEQQEGVMLQLDNRRQSISGVSIDEEMINLIKFQQAYQAAARLINVVDEMFDIIQERI